MLRLPDAWVWDFWCARRGPEHHVFYLQAPRALGDPELRHRNASIGHAVSHDLATWRVLPDAIRPGPPGSWDDAAVWTGSVIASRSGGWWCFYTGVNAAEDTLVQRVGAALSDDLVAWRKHPGNPLIELDPGRYELLDRSVWHDQAWRDPWVMAADGGYQAYLTARCRAGDPAGRGVIGLAHSRDLESWRVDDPVTLEPAGQFGQLEVPQVVELEGRWYLIFCTGAETHSRAWRRRTGAAPRTGTYYALADGPDGGFRLVDSAPLGPDDGSTCYAGRIVPTDDGPRFLAWRMYDSAGVFAAEIIDPMTVAVGPDGNLRLS